MPKVSVCIPTYNRSAYLRQAIESVQAQTYRDYELLVLDNVSTDGTPQVVAGVKDARVRYFRNERRLSIIASYNRCLELARGQYVALLPDDDLWLPRFLERTVSILDSHPRVGFAHTALYVMDDRGKKQKLSRKWKTDRIFPEAELPQRFLRGGYPQFYVCTLIMRRECYEEVGLLDERLTLAYDWELMFRISLHYGSAYVAEPLACFRLHESSEGMRLLASESPVFYFQKNEEVMARVADRIEALEGERRRRLKHDLLRCQAYFHLVHQGWLYWTRAEFRQARREVADAIAMYPWIILQKPHTIAAILVTSLLGQRITTRLDRLRGWYTDLLYYRPVEKIDGRSQG